MLLKSKQSVNKLWNWFTNFKSTLPSDFPSRRLVHRVTELKYFLISLERVRSSFEQDKLLFWREFDQLVWENVQSWFKRLSKGSFTGEGLSRSRRVSCSYKDIPEDFWPGNLLKIWEEIELQSSFNPIGSHSFNEESLLKSRKLLLVFRPESEDSWLEGDSDQFSKNLLRLSFKDIGGDGGPGRFGSTSYDKLFWFSLQSGDTLLVSNWNNSRSKPGVSNMFNN